MRLPGGCLETSIGFHTGPLTPFGSSDVRFRWGVARVQGAENG